MFNVVEIFEDISGYKIKFKSHNLSDCFDYIKNNFSTTYYIIDKSGAIIEFDEELKLLRRQKLAA